MSIGLQYGVDKFRDVMLGPIAKATLEFCDNNGKAVKSIQCGFNPTEYSVSHSLGYYNTNGIGKPFDIKNLKFGRGEFSVLSVSVFVDDKSNMESSIVKYGGGIYNAVRCRGRKNPKNVKEMCQFLEEFMHYDSKEKTTPYIAFNWGEMRFVGKLKSINVQFIMFDRAGNPTRAKIAMQIAGEDNYFINKSDFFSKEPTVSAARETAQTLGKLNPRL